jgi:hypothetical protein
VCVHVFLQRTLRNEVKRWLNRSLQAVRPPSQAIFFIPSGICRPYSLVCVLSESREALKTLSQVRKQRDQRFSSWMSYAERRKGSLAEEAGEAERSPDFAGLGPSRAEIGGTTCFGTDLLSLVARIGEKQQVLFCGKAHTRRDVFSLPSSFLTGFSSAAGCSGAWRSLGAAEHRSDRPRLRATTRHTGVSGSGGSTSDPDGGGTKNIYTTKDISHLRVLRILPGFELRLQRLQACDDVSPSPPQFLFR